MCQAPWASYISVPHSVLPPGLAYSYRHSHCGETEALCSITVPSQGVNCPNLPLVSCSRLEALLKTVPPPARCQSMSREPAVPGCKTSRSAYAAHPVTSAIRTHRGPARGSCSLAAEGASTPAEKHEGRDPGFHLPFPHQRKLTAAL